MSLYEFVLEHAILTDYDLDSYEGKEIWLVLTVNSNNGKDWYATKIPWTHNGLYNHKGNKYGDSGNNKIVLCQNGNNNDEYFVTVDFMPGTSSSNLNAIFPSEDIADAFINSAIITRDSTAEHLNSMLSKTVLDRSFALRNSDDLSLFDMISYVNESVLESIPIFQKDS